MAAPSDSVKKYRLFLKDANGSMEPFKHPENDADLFSQDEVLRFIHQGWLDSRCLCQVKGEKVRRPIHDTFKNWRPDWAATLVYHHSDEQQGGRQVAEQLKQQLTAAALPCRVIRHFGADVRLADSGAVLFILDRSSGERPTLVGAVQRDCVQGKVPLFVVEADAAAGGLCDHLRAWDGSGGGAVVGRASAFRDRKAAFAAVREFVRQHGYPVRRPILTPARVKIAGYVAAVGLLFGLLVPTIPGLVRPPVINPVENPDDHGRKPMPPGHDGSLPSHATLVQPLETLPSPLDGLRFVQKLPAVPRSPLVPLDVLEKKYPSTCKALEKGLSQLVASRIVEAGPSGRPSRLTSILLWNRDSGLIWLDESKGKAAINALSPVTLVDPNLKAQAKWIVDAAGFVPDVADAGFSEAFAFWNNRMESNLARPRPRVNLAAGAAADGNIIPKPFMRQLGDAEVSWKNSLAVIVLAGSVPEALFELSGTTEPWDLDYETRTERLPPIWEILRQGGAQLADRRRPSSATGDAAAENHRYSDAELAVALFLLNQMIEDRPDAPAGDGSIRRTRFLFDPVFSRSLTRSLHDAAVADSRAQSP